MEDQKALFSELKPAIEAVSTPLIDFSKQCLRDRGDFLPHAALLTYEGKLALSAAKPERDLTNAAEVLPLLHSGLRLLVKEKGYCAVGVAESVSVIPPGQSQRTAAIKVLFEHQRGLTVALYVPFAKKFLKGYVYGNSFSILAAPEVNPWSPSENNQ